MLGPAASGSPGDLLEVHILRATARPVESKFLGVGPGNPDLTRLSDDSDTHQSVDKPT